MSTVGSVGGPVAIIPKLDLAKAEAFRCDSDSATADEPSAVGDVLARWMDRLPWWGSRDRSQKVFNGPFICRCALVAKQQTICTSLN